MCACRRHEALFKILTRAGTEVLVCIACAEWWARLDPSVIVLDKDD